MTDDDFNTILEALGSKQVPKGEKESLMDASERGIHAALVGVIASYRQPDGSVQIPPGDTAAMFLEALKFLQGKPTYT
jgi:hypothetical protein